MGGKAAVLVTELGKLRLENTQGPSSLSRTVTARPASLCTLPAPLPFTQDSVFRSPFGMSHLAYPHPIMQTMTDAPSRAGPALGESHLPHHLFP